MKGQRQATTREFGRTGIATTREDNHKRSQRQGIAKRVQSQGIVPTDVSYFKMVFSAPFF
ncbi:MAG TPA: hypothetical protein DCM38_02500 [Gammaproteobacteria bacterium]|nr:hypothetical protein [Gammaproteobacteria bacterium]